MDIHKLTEKEKEELFIVESTGNYRLSNALFLEPNYKADGAVFTTGERHKTYKGKKYYSLKKLYLDMADATEYEFATTYLFSFSHWKAMLKKASFRKEVEEWREELRLKMMSKVIKAQVESAEDGSTGAAKFLANREWEPKAAGRPSKEKVAGELKQAAELASEFEEDFKRLGI